MTSPTEDERVRRHWYEELRSRRSVEVFELELFLWYLRDTEAMLERSYAEESSYVQEQIAAGYEDVNDSGMLASDYQARRVRYSHVIHLTALLETVLKRECERLALALGDQGAPIAPTEIKGNQWTSKKKFLERFGHLRIPDSLWTPMWTLIEVRNAIVHDNGIVNKLPNPFTSVAGVPTGITITSGEIELTRDFIAESFTLVKDLAEYLHSEVGQVIARRLRPQDLS